MDYEPTGSLPPEGPAAPKPRARKAATKKEFLQLPRNKGLKVCILASAILCYVLAGLGTLVLVTAILDPEVNAVAEIGILLTILILGHLIFALPLGLGIHLRQSRVCAVLLLLLAALGIALDRFLGFEIALISCAVVLALYGTFLLEKRWRAYRDAEPWQSEVSRAYEEPDAEPTISRKEFLELPENEKLKKRIHTNANACYVLLGVSAVFCAILTAVEYLSVSDLVLEMILLGVILTLVVGVHKRQSLTCGVALGVIVALSALLALIEGESRGLSLAELACIGLFAQSIQLEQQRKKYCQKQAQSPGAQPEPNSDPKGETPMKYVCPCGYEYDPAVGDPDNGVAPGTPFEAIPDSWVCPVCGLEKGEFVPA